MIVRKAHPNDLESVAELRHRLWPEGSLDEHRREARATLAGRPHSTLPLVILVAETGGGLAGFIEVGLRSHADGCDPSRPCGFIEGWYVAPEHRGKSVGRLLMLAAEDWARQQGAFELASDTWISEEAAQRAHAALGFEVVDRCVNYKEKIAEPPRAHYASDLARAHHRHFGRVARAAARELLARLAGAGIGSGTVVDLAAGSGILSRALAAAGFSVVGVDISEDMLEIARQEAPAARFTRGSLWSAELAECVAVAAVGEAFSYATDPRAGLAALESRLADIHRALAPGGLLLFDVAGPGRGGPERARRVFWDYADVALGVEEQESDGRLERNISVFVPEGERYRRVQEKHVLRLYAPQDVERLLEAAGFEWRALSGYDDLGLSPGWHAYLARKPEPTPGR